MDDSGVKWSIIKRSIGHFQNVRYILINILINIKTYWQINVFYKIKRSF
jgi:hypothetical protein